jgi:type VI secretion system secreted protein Hcp
MVAMAMDMFIKLDDIKGESGDHAHKAEIDVLSWSWGETQSGSAHHGAGQGAGKVNVQDLTFTKHTDRSTPNLLAICASGKHIKQAVLTVRKAGDKPLEYLKITMTQCIITSVSLGGDGGGDRLTENISLNFAQVKYEYTPQKADGTGDAVVTMGWDIAANKAIG